MKNRSSLRARSACLEKIRNRTIELQYKVKGRIALKADNWIGIEDEKISASDSFGLIGMRERAQNLGGELKINSTRDGGTKITLTVPFREGNLDDKNNHHR